jgi:hypothetical protein
MDDLLLYGPWVLCVGAVLLAGGARVAASRALARLTALENAVASLRAPAPRPSPSATPSPSPAVAAPAASARGAEPAAGPCAAVLEERLGALEARLATLASAVSDAAVPEPDDVAPMRPPVPSSVEPVAAPRSGWRMFP